MVHSAGFGLWIISHFLSRKAQHCWPGCLFVWLRRPDSVCQEVHQELVLEIEMLLLLVWYRHRPWHPGSDLHHPGVFLKKERWFALCLLPLSFWRPGHHSMKLPYLYYCCVHSSQKFWTPTLLSAKYHCYHLHIVNKIPNPSNYTFIFFLLNLQVLCTWQLIWLIPDTQHELLWDYSMCADSSRGTAVRELIAWSLKGALTPAQQQVFLFPPLFLTLSQRSYTNPREDEGENPDELWRHFMLIVPWVDIAL